MLLPAENELCFNRTHLEQTVGFTEFPVLVILEEVLIFMGYDPANDVSGEHSLEVCPGFVGLGLSRCRSVWPFPLHTGPRG